MPGPWWRIKSVALCCVCLSGMRVCVSILLSGRRVSKRKVREFLNMDGAHACLEVGDGEREFSLLWGSKYGEYSYDGAGKRFALNLGKSVRVWGELYEPCDVRDFVLEGNGRKLGSVLKTYEEMGKARAGAWECEGELKKLSGCASSSAVWELVKAADVMGARESGIEGSVMTVGELHEYLVRCKQQQQRFTAAVKPVE